MPCFSTGNLYNNFQSHDMAVFYLTNRQVVYGLGLSLTGCVINTQTYQCGIEDEQYQKSPCQSWLGICFILMKIYSVLRD